MSDAKITELNTGKKLFIDITPGPPSPSPVRSSLAPTCRTRAHHPTNSSTHKQPTIVFLHGLGSSTSFYESPLSLSALSTSHQLVRYDFDGHGLSPVSGYKVTIESLVEDLKHVMESVDCEKAGIVAHSMSGLVALTFAAKYPEMVDRLFLIGPVKALPPAGVDAMLARAVTVRTSGLSSLASTIANSATSAHTKSTSPLSLALIRALVLPTPIEGYARACEALAAAKNPEWSNIKAEVLVVGGEEDYMCTREVVSFLVENIEKARSVEMKNVGHWHAVEQPVELARIMDEFFALEGTTFA
ncbi:hypothetical protein P7C70_g1585, partial [Phenoliferia sp. Uapishka_3]